MLQPPVQLDHTSSDIVYHTTIPIYSILFTAVALGAAVILRRYYIHLKREPKSKAEEHHYEDAEKPATPSRAPATFSLKVLK